MAISIGWGTAQAALARIQRQARVNRDAGAACRGQSVGFKRTGRQHPTAGPFGRGCELPIHPRVATTAGATEYGRSLECRNM
jgi:hypothetical protein